MKVKRTLLIAAVGCGCLAFGLQTAQKKYVILDDKKGGFKIYDVESVLGSFEPDGDYGFEAKGSPIRGFSKEQGLVFSARSMNGVAERTSDGSFRIKNAKATGEVIIDVTKTNTDQSTTKSHIDAMSLTITETESEATMTFPTAFTFSDHLVSTGVDRVLEVKAPSGTFVLPRLSQTGGSNNPFKSATVQGPVNVMMDSKKVVAQGTNRQLVKVRADRMTYNGETRKLRLDGNVVADVEMTPATGKPVQSVTNVGWVEIELDENSGFKRMLVGGGSGQLSGGGNE